MKWFKTTVVLFTLLTSCISYRYIDIQVLNPGTANLPSPITLHITEPDRTDTSFSPLHKLFIHNFDSTVKKHFETSPLFERSKIVLQTTTEFNKEMKVKPIEEQKRNVLLSFKLMQIVEKKEYIGYDNDCECYTNMKSFVYTLKIDLVNVSTDYLYDAYMNRDTIIWTDEDFSKNTYLPKVIATIGNLAAKKYVQKTAPIWITEERTLFFNGNKYMRRGYDKFVQNDLDGALLQWNHLFEIGTPTLASIAAYNMALVYEMQDNLDDCEKWLNTSLSTKYSSLAESYLTRIKQRKTDRSQIGKQLENLNK